MELKSSFSSFVRRIPQLKLRPNRLSFADPSYYSHGKALLPLITPPGKPAIFVEMDVVKADIPALLGLDVLNRESLMAGTGANRLTKRGVATENG